MSIEHGLLDKTMQKESVQTLGMEHLLERAEQVLQKMEQILSPTLQEPDWHAAIAFRYRKQGNVMGWSYGQLQPVRHIGPMDLETLQAIDTQKQRLFQNTSQFVAGKTANNVLLTGARGTGKSSLVRACLRHFSSQGLRLIEVEKKDLIDLPEIVALLANRPEKFIVYCDDLSFEEGESEYKALKSVLDGTVAAPAANVLIYATSNRRHLMPEYMQENLNPTTTANGEIHPGEGIEEKVSLSERFGLWISFYPFSQEEYLAIVRQWLTNLGVLADAHAAAEKEALVWALERGSRSGRVAWQFARDYAGRQRS